MLDKELSFLLISLVLLLSFSLLLGHLFTMIKLPRVIGEISAGLLLGPSFFGYFSPFMQSSIFNGFVGQEKLLSVFYWFGLILLMFTAGFKIPNEINKKDFFKIWIIILGGLSLPFIFGFFASPLFKNEASPNLLAFSLVIAIASAITSIPVLTRIFMDLKMLGSRFAQIVLTSAAFQDIILWIILSVALVIQQGKSYELIDLYDVLYVIGGTVLFVCISLIFLPKILDLLKRTSILRSFNDELIGYTLLICLVIVSLAKLLQVNMVFGALVAGLVIGRLQGLKSEQIKENITNISSWFFVPIYFAMVGLQMDLPSSFDGNLIIMFFLFTSIVKILSVALFIKITKETWLNALDFGMTMNARGGPGIVLASVVFAAEIIDEKLFVALVLTSILTSLISGIWLLWRRDVIIRNNYFT